MNGGKCVAPGKCLCKRGFTGDSCEKDFDECAAGLHVCKDSTHCINMAGWHYCKCKPGYVTQGAECYDINECYHNIHSCHTSADCVNTIGHFECHCRKENPSCRLSKINNTELLTLLLNSLIKFNCRLHV